MNGRHKSHSPQVLRWPLQCLRSNQPRTQQPQAAPLATWPSWLIASSISKLATVPENKRKFLQLSNRQKKSGCLFMVFVENCWSESGGVARKLGRSGSEALEFGVSQGYYGLAWVVAWANSNYISLVSEWTNCALFIHCWLLCVQRVKFRENSFFD